MGATSESRCHLGRGRRREPWESAALSRRKQKGMARKVEENLGICGFTEPGGEDRGDRPVLIGFVGYISVRAIPVEWLGQNLVALSERCNRK